jgi:phage terminase small subunit
MARHPQPREVAELKGAVRHDPQRYRKELPEVVQPLGQAPEHLSEAAKAAWFEVESLAPVKVLKGADRIALELLANLIVEYRAAPSEFASRKYTVLISLLARLGMTPADRQKLGTEKPAEGNPFDEF